MINGRIMTMDERGVVEALVSDDGRVVFLGSSDEALAYRDKDTKVIDLRGYYVLPGLIDAHLHLAGLGFSLDWINLRGVRSIEEMKARIRQESQDKELILCRGWDQELFAERRFPTRHDLDEAMKDKPVIAFRICGHLAVLNTKALELIGLRRILEGPYKEYFERDEKGNLNGIVKEKGLSLVHEAIRGDEEYYLSAIRRACIEAAKHGITMVHAMSCTLEELKAIVTLRSRGELPIRVRAYLSYDVFKTIENIERLRAMNDDMFKVCGIKVIADGSLGARTAYLSEPYHDEPSTRGELLISKEELGEIMDRALDTNMQVAIHAIGDGAVEMVLEVFEDRKEEVTRLRHRIEHASVLNEDVVELLRTVKPVVVVQPHFIISDWWIVRRLGQRRARLAYPFKTLMRHCVVAFSSDAPVEPVNPWVSIEAAVTRGMDIGIELGKLTAHERLSLEEALRCYTTGSSYACSEERRAGVLREGGYADFVVVDKNPLNTSKVKVLATFVNGNKVYEARPGVVEAIQA
ncbi:MAG: amidohydrolase [Thermoprotei archaeon]|nr:MAG: amidohydrolase [Thermoprotei archaeon]